MNKKMRALAAGIALTLFSETIAGVIQRNAEFADAVDGEVDSL